MAQAFAPLPPGPKAPAVWQLLRYSHSPLPFLEACARRFGDPFTLQFAGYGTLVMLASPDAVQDVFRGDPHTLHSGETADETGNRARESAGTVRHIVRHVAPRGRIRQVGGLMDLFFGFFSQAGTWSAAEVTDWFRGAGLEARKSRSPSMMPGLALHVGRKPT